MLSKENVLNEIRILKEELLTNYKKREYPDAYSAEVMLLNRFEDMIENEIYHPYNKK